MHSPKTGTISAESWFASGILHHIDFNFDRTRRPAIGDVAGLPVPAGVRHCGCCSRKLIICLPRLLACRAFAADFEMGGADDIIV